MSIISHRPTRYLTQPFYRYCGIFQIITILESRFRIEKKPHEIFTGFSKLTWFCVPRQIVRKFNELGLNAAFMKKHHLTTDSIKSCLLNNKNVILLTGHGYSKTGKTFNAIKALFSQHYISIWGYDDARKWFFVYDSTIKESTESGLPVWNIFLPERIVKRSLARAWRGMLDDVIIVV